jgi:hypothetical protein
MFIKSRYDILLGRPGTEILEEPKPSVSLDDDRLIIYGPRRSGRTQALIDDMVNYSSMGNNVCFFSENQARNDIVRGRAIFSGLANPFNFFTYDRPLAIRGLDCDGLYLDDFSHRFDDDFSSLWYCRTGYGGRTWRRDFFNAITPLFCHQIRIVIASLAKEMPFDTTGWTFRELIPRYDWLDI